MAWQLAQLGEPTIFSTGIGDAMAIFSLSKKILTPSHLNSEWSRCLLFRPLLKDVFDVQKGVPSCVSGPSTHHEIGTRLQLKLLHQYH